MYPSRQSIGKCVIELVESEMGGEFVCGCGGE